MDAKDLAAFLSGIEFAQVVAPIADLSPVRLSDFCGRSRPSHNRCGAQELLEVLRTGGAGPGAEAGPDKNRRAAATVSFDFSGLVATAVVAEEVARDEDRDGRDSPPPQMAGSAVNREWQSGSGDQWAAAEGADGGDSAGEDGDSDAMAEESAGPVGRAADVLRILEREQRPVSKQYILRQFSPPWTHLEWRGARELLLKNPRVVYSARGRVYSLAEDGASQDRMLMKMRELADANPRVTSVQLSHAVGCSRKAAAEWLRERKKDTTAGAQR